MYCNNKRCNILEVHIHTKFVTDLGVIADSKLHFEDHVQGRMRKAYMFPGIQTRHLIVKASTNPWCDHNWNVLRKFGVQVGLDLLQKLKRFRKE